MIVSVNSKPDLSEFKNLMLKTDQVLNEDAKKRPKYYATRGGNPLEDDVKSALEECAIGTPFENTIEKISGQKFPDIVAARFYGVEVKAQRKIIGRQREVVFLKQREWLMLKEYT